MKIYVGNLSFQVTEDRLRKLFASHGKVTNVKIATDLETGHPRGFAFVEMANEGDAKEAIAVLNGFVLDGRRLTLRKPIPAPPIGFNALSLNG